MNTHTKPATGTREWAKKTINIQYGCSNDCAYCYAKSMAVVRKIYKDHPKTVATWKIEEIDQGKVNKRYFKIDGVVMFPSTHDITQTNVDACLIVLKKLLAAGNEVLIVSKPRLEVIQKLCRELEEYKSKILFRFTIGSTDSAVLKEYEPGASSFEERLECLKLAYQLGFSTSISAEPMLDLDPYALYTATEPFITDTIWFGRINRINNILPNKHPENVSINTKLNTLLAAQDIRFIEELYQTYSANPKVRWKDSIKEALGI